MADMSRRALLVSITAAAAAAALPASLAPFRGILIIDDPWNPQPVPAPLFTFLRMLGEGDRDFAARITQVLAGSALAEARPA